MITFRKASERGRTSLDWLDSRHTFAFGDYYDPRFLGYRSLRVLNDDRVAPAAGFGMHPHRDMEILTWVLSGALEHRDSLGTGSIIRPGDLQRMTAGTGIRHSEINPSDKEAVHFLQVWLVPEKTGLAPDYEQRNYPRADRRGKLVHVAGPSAGNGAVGIRQNANVYATLLEKGESVTHELAPGRHAWIQVATGTVSLNGQELSAGDGAAVSDTKKLTLSADRPAEVLLFDLA
jgi:redox-sensitive bicupin YhaK (pirin superfamily)